MAACDFFIVFWFCGVLPLVATQQIARETFCIPHKKRKKNHVIKKQNTKKKFSKIRRNWQFADALSDRISSIIDRLYVIDDAYQ
jgi:hypothetical protein